MWFLALVLGVGALSLATAALPGRAKPLLLLPLAFGLASAGLSLALRRSLSIRSSLPIWGITTALALGGYGQVVISSFQKFQSQAGAAQAADDKAAIAIEMLKGTEHNDLAEKMEQDRANRHDGWDDYLSRRYASLGRFAPQNATWPLAVEALMVIAGVAVGRRLLDAKPSTCQAAGPVANAGDGTKSS
jgi:hypothetical protein